MPQGQESGKSETLTVETAASAMAALDSREENRPPKKQPRPKAEEPEEASEEDEQPEQLESEEESEEPAEPSEEGDDVEDLPQEDEDDEPAPEPRKIKVKIDGVESEVTEEEAAAGYQRTADYTRKSQAHSEEVKKFKTEEVPALRAERQQLATQLGEIAEALKSFTPVEPDWEELRKGDRDEFAATWADWQRHKEQIATVEKAQKAALDKVADDQRSHLVDHIESEKVKLVEAVPAWSNAELAKKEKDAIFAFAQKEGYTQEELKEVYDHRVLKLLRKAWLHDKAQSALPKAKAKIQQIKTATPGPTAAGKQPKATKLEQAKQRLAQSGSIKDAAAAMALLEGDE